MKDIVEELQDWLVLDAMPTAIARRALDEIIRLRSLAGAVSPGRTLAQIRDAMRAQTAVAGT